MAPPTRKRRASDIRGPDGESPPQRRRTQATQLRGRTNGESSTQGAQRNRRRASTPEDEDGDIELEGTVENGDPHGDMHKDRLVRNLVRLALAHEYTRAPIRRQDITSKVLGAHGRQFKDVFEQAQKQLRRVFGMELVELPIRAKTKLAQRRAAQTTEKGSTTSKSYILTNVLPAEYRDSRIVQPFGFKEQTYTGLVTMVVSLIYLNNRLLPASKLNRYLRRMNADEATPIGQTDKLLQTMQRNGYIVRVKDTAGDETSYDYHIGPRAKVEIGEDGVKEFLKNIYGVHAPKDLNERTIRNMGPELKAFENEEDREAVAGGGRQRKKAPVKRARGRRAAIDEEEEDDEGD